MTEPLETQVFSALRDVLSGDTRLARRLALLEPTKKLAHLLAGVGASLNETPLSSIGMPSEDLFAHCSREISGAQVDAQGDSRHATSVVPC